MSFLFLLLGFCPLFTSHFHVRIPRHGQIWSIYITLNYHRAPHNCALTHFIQHMLNIFLFGLFRFQPLECEPGTRHLSASCWNLLLLSESVYSLSTIILHGWNIKPFSSPVFKSGSIQQLWKRQRLTHISLEAISPATVRKLFWNTVGVTVQDCCVSLTGHRIRTYTSPQLSDIGAFKCLCEASNDN